MLSSDPTTFAKPLQNGSPCDFGMPLSAWSTSSAKRVFDVLVVLAFTPAILPVLLIVGLLVRLSSAGPILFRQTRIGRFGTPFTILKFRTMLDCNRDGGSGIACADDERITAVGRILRRLKLDELPQFINVLRGDMSLVGPRPRIAEQQTGGPFPCRPGITGPATLAFAREDLLLAQVPPHLLLQFYRENLSPAKQQLDSAYMARATIVSDLRLLLLTAAGRWQTGAAVSNDATGADPKPQVELAAIRFDMEVTEAANGGQ
jgi:lipopolysaccharide/colanic/teichoic acid biosynthesis glycosyltransferase